MNDLGIERDGFMEGVQAIANSVYSFHDRFDIDRIDTADPDGTLEALRQRLSLLTEEAGEHARELNRGNVEEAIDEAVDIAYIALGTVLRLGAQGRDSCLAVAQKNDAKSASTHSKRPGTGKVVAR